MTKGERSSTDEAWQELLYILGTLKKCLDGISNSFRIYFSDLRTSWSDLVEQYQSENDTWIYSQTLVIDTSLEI